MSASAVGGDGDSHHRPSLATPNFVGETDKGDLKAKHVGG
jgi:hypothetical protein